MTKLKLSDFWLIMRSQGSFEKINNSGEKQKEGEKERPNKGGLTP